MAIAIHARAGGAVIIGGVPIRIHQIEADTRHQVGGGCAAILKGEFQLLTDDSKCRCQRRRGTASADNHDPVLLAVIRIRDRSRGVIGRGRRRDIGPAGALIGAVLPQISGRAAADDGGKSCRRPAKNR